MRDTLTAKQETYTQNLFKGMYQRDAYIDAYKANYALSTIDANASRLASNEKVKVRLAELQQIVLDNSIATVQERKARLTEFGREDVISPKTGTLIRSGNIQAIAELNKMEHIYETNVSVHNFTFKVSYEGDDDVKVLPPGDDEKLLGESDE